MAEADETSRKRVVRKEEGIVVTLPPIKAPHWLQGFVDFIREQGVVGLAIGLILGVAAKSVVDSLVNNIFNPLVGALSGGPDLSTKFICIRHATDSSCTSKVGYGHVVNDLISFLIIVFIVYFVVKSLKLDKLDRKKST
ncbi:MAG TPA: MscL family protein [Patescibacteria group bacterium]|nr:MscL family protein [Patescibacteria group bacterium]